MARSSYVLRMLNIDEDEDEPLETIVAGPITQALGEVSANSYVMLARRWGVYLGLKAARYSWVFGTSLLILLFPIWVEVQREDVMNAFEAEQVALYTARGYSSFQIESMKMRGELGVNPAPPPQQPGFP